MTKVTTDENKIKKILSRGVEDVIVKESLEARLKSGKELRIKFGIDPTGPKIHLGRAVVLRKLREFQDLGHKIVLIIGDFTATIGDPSDKLSKRPMLTRDDVKKYLENYEGQLGKIIDLEKAEVHYNSSWLDKMNARELTELAESFSVQQMLARRNFKDRFEKGEEISLRETFYPLFQGYDSVAIKADVEIGGFDQLFNVKAGRVVQKYYSQPEQDILTTTMLEGTDGRKMSTSWGNVINITDEPNDMFGKVMSVRDDLIVKYFLLCTNLSEEEIQKIDQELQSGKINPRDFKMQLGREIIKIYYSESAAAEAEENFIKVFSKKEIPDEVEEVKVEKSELSVLDLVITAGFAKSKSEARRLIEQGGVELNQERKDDPNEVLSLKGGEILKAGKRRFGKVVISK